MLAATINFFCYLKIPVPLTSFIIVSSVPFSAPFLSLFWTPPIKGALFFSAVPVDFFKKQFASYAALNARWRCNLVGKDYPKQRYLKWEWRSFYNSKFRHVWYSPLSFMGGMLVPLFTVRHLKILVAGRIGTLLGDEKSARPRILPIKHTLGNTLGWNLQNSPKGEAHEGFADKFSIQKQRHKHPPKNNK